MKSVDMLICISFSDEQPGIRQEQEADFKKIFEKLDPEIPFICLSGNHDIGNRPTAETINLLVICINLLCQ
jgi:predicted MPP superfamily phosphohydrolase